jgi:hypothetical protein
MDLINIHAGSYATRIGQTAAAEVAGLLAIEDAETVWSADDFQNWFDRTRAADDAGLADILDALGEYVCINQVDAGERLYRYATGERLVAPIGAWDTLGFAQQQPWETFTGTCRQAFNGLKAAQLAIVDARKAAALAAPSGLKLEDSIFEETEDLFALRPEAVESLKLTAIYERGQAAERQRLAFAAEDAMRAEAEAYNADWDKFGGDPARFDHDGNGKPGGSKRKPKPQRPAPLSAGEAPARQRPNQGGRGNKKTS